jgi:hypothetical protein
VTLYERFRENLLSQMMHLNGFFLHEQMQHVISYESLKKSANDAFEWFFSIMNRYSMCFHIPLLKTAVLTNVTLNDCVFLHEQMQHEK